MSAKVDITVLPDERCLTVTAGNSLFFHLAEAGFSINQACGGRGICGKCRVRLTGRIPVSSDLDEKFLSPEDIEAGFRLACGVIPTGGEIVDIYRPALETATKFQLKAAGFSVDPWPGLKPADLVLALDLGTSTVVGHLLDPFSGRVIHSAVTANGQMAFGADVVTRLAYASHGGREARLRLQTLAFDNLRNVLDALMDIGTNAEVALVASGGISACSCAAGPAFEGGGISQGMRAMEGAISRVRLARKQIEIDVIGGGEACGITGSGLISLAGELLRAKALDRFGMIQPDRLSPDIIVEDDQGRRLQLTSHVSVSENDIQQLMLAKAAVRAGSELLLSKSGVRPQALTGVILSGTFANSLCAEDVLSIGLIPLVKSDIIYMEGNTAAEGACMMACSRTAFNEVIAIAKNTHHFRLSGDSDFNRIFQENVSFKSEELT